MQSKPLTFKELKEGDTFIDFPIDGDDSGHGGFRKGFHLFTKSAVLKGREDKNAVRNNDKSLTAWNPDQQVLLIT